MIKPGIKTYVYLFPLAHYTAFVTGDGLFTVKGAVSHFTAFCDGEGVSYFKGSH